MMMIPLVYHGGGAPHTGEQWQGTSHFITCEKDHIPDFLLLLLQSALQPHPRWPASFLRDIRALSAREHWHRLVGLSIT